MIILGIDPGTATTGFGIISENNGEIELIEYGAITTKAGIPLEERLNQIAEDLQNLITEFKPDAACIEELFFTNNIKTGISVAHARGVIVQILNKNNIQLKSFTPTQVKSSITGYGKADKHQVQTMTKIILNLLDIPKPDDAADALAIAICGSNSFRI